MQLIPGWYTSLPSHNHCTSILSMPFMFRIMQHTLLASGSVGSCQLDAPKALSLNGSSQPSSIQSWKSFRTVTEVNRSKEKHSDNGWQVWLALLSTDTLAPRGLFSMDNYIKFKKSIMQRLYTESHHWKCLVWWDSYPKSFSLEVVGIEPENGRTICLCSATELCPSLSPIYEADLHWIKIRQSPSSSILPTLDTKQKLPRFPSPTTWGPLKLRWTWELLWPNFEDNPSSNERGKRFKFYITFTS